MSEQTIWGIHAGQYGEADELFRERNVIAIGDYMGDLSGWKDREDYKNAYVKANPGSAKMKVAINAGVCYRFVHEIQRHDLVVYPAKYTGEVLIGRIVGDYQYAPNISKEYPNQRKVEWVRPVPRTGFSQGALYEMGAAMTLFQIKNYAHEILAVLEGKPIPPDDEDETISLVTEDIEQQTRDFVLKRLSQALKGHPLSEGETEKGTFYFSLA
ncbi:MAG: restriction endonuclease [Candidatus Methylomirabilis sp.]